MHSRIFVRGLEVPCRIGISEEERAQSRTLLVDVELEVDIEEAAISDDIAMTLDYRRVRDTVMEVAGSHEFRLVESFARNCAIALSNLRGVRSLRIRVEKPYAPRGAAGAGVEVEM